MANEEKPPEASDVKPKFDWEYKQDLGINVKMKEVLRATLKACEAERDLLVTKLNKMQCGG